MEGNKKSRPRAILVFGAPCSGKTTFAEKFAGRFDLAYYNFDEIKEQNKLTRKNVLLFITLLARTGRTFIFEGGVDTEKQRAEMRNTLRMAGYEPSLIWVQTDINTIRARMKAKYRSGAKAKEAYDMIVAGMEAPTELEHPIILSGKHTFETQTRHVLSGLADTDKK